MSIGLIFSLAGLFCAIIIIVDAFRDEAWKGILAFFVPLYLIYYAFAEFEHDQKWLIILGYFAGTVGSIVMRVMATH